MAIKTATQERDNMQPTIKELINDDEVMFVVNHSGGKDSQAMYGMIKDLVPQDRILVLYAELKGIVWSGTKSHILSTIDDGAAFQTVSHAKGATFFSLARLKGMFPSPKFRSCTSQLKTGPLDKAIRHELKRRGLLKVVSCIGIRALESPARAKHTEFKLDVKNSKAGRSWYVWLPIFDWSEPQVFQFIKNYLGQKPHWAYLKGMTRLSCCFCIMASLADLKTAARLRPELLQEYIALEAELNQTMLMPKAGQARPWLKDLLKDVIK